MKRKQEPKRSWFNFHFGGSAGWYKGQPFMLFRLSLWETIDMGADGIDSIIVIGIQIGKLCLELIIEKD